VVTGKEVIMEKNGSVKIRHCRQDRIFYFLNDLWLFLSMIVVLYPVIYVLSSSFSSANAVSTGKVILWPVDFSLAGYKAVFEHNGIVRGYLNTIYYTTLGTFINIIMTVLVAYPLSRNVMPGKKALSILFTFTMMFSGGLIPSYLVNSSLKLVNTRWVMLIPGALSIYNMIIAKSYFENNIPRELEEASQIDGCDHVTFLIKVVLPLSKSILAVLVLFYAVTHWNSYFDAFIYLNDEKLYPLQIVLRDILISNSVDGMIIDPELMAAKQGLSDLLKYSLIVVSSVPFMLVYPFIQKYFVKGTLVGAVKG
jgi:putative aldouronate transport system permease protein